MKRTQKKASPKMPHSEKFLFGILFALVLFAAFSFTMLSLGDSYLAKGDLKKATFFYSLTGFPHSQKIMMQRQLALRVSKDLRRIYAHIPYEATNSGQLQEEKVVGKGIVVPVLMYHYIRVNPNPTDTVGYHLSVSPENFALQMEYLAKNNYHTITTDELVPALWNKALLPEKPIIITFDDGYADSHDTALPILKKYDLKAISFVATGLVGAPNYLTWEKISDMKKSGVFFFGAHTVHHFALTYLSSEAVKQELLESKKELESRLGYPINSFAYPYGSLNAAVEQSVKSAGFLIAFGTQLGYQHAAGQIYGLPRIRIGGTDTLFSFVAKLPWR